MSTEKESTQALYELWSDAMNDRPKQDNISFLLAASRQQALWDAYRVAAEIAADHQNKNRPDHVSIPIRDAVLQLWEKESKAELAALEAYKNGWDQRQELRWWLAKARKETVWVAYKIVKEIAADHQNEGSR